MLHEFIISIFTLTRFIYLFIIGKKNMFYKNICMCMCKCIKPGIIFNNVVVDAAAAHICIEIEINLHFDGGVNFRIDDLRLIVCN